MPEGMEGRDYFEWWRMHYHYYFTKMLPFIKIKFHPRSTTSTNISILILEIKFTHQNQQVDNITKQPYHSAHMTFVYLLTLFTFTASVVGSQSFKETHNWIDTSTVTDTKNQFKLEEINLHILFVLYQNVSGNFACFRLSNSEFRRLLSYRNTE